MLKSLFMHTREEIIFEIKADPKKLIFLLFKI
jgi:hypothetical protein